MQVLLHLKCPCIKYSSPRILQSITYLVTELNLEMLSHLKIFRKIWRKNVCIVEEKSRGSRYPVWSTKVRLLYFKTLLKGPSHSKKKSVKFHTSIGGEGTPLPEIKDFWTY